MEQRGLNEQELADAWLEGFIKECEARDVDPEQLLSILTEVEETQQENK